MYLQKAQELSDEVKQATQQYYMKQSQDPQFKAEVDAELASNFQKADLDKDGRLNEDEFVEFLSLTD